MSVRDQVEERIAEASALLDVVDPVEAIRVLAQGLRIVARALDAPAPPAARTIPRGSVSVENAEAQVRAGQALGAELLALVGSIGISWAVPELEASATRVVAAFLDENWRPGDRYEPRTSRRG